MNCSSFTVSNKLFVSTPAGAYKPEIKLYEVVIVESAYSESTFALTQAGELQNILYANADLTEQLKGIASELSIPVRVGRTHSMYSTEKTILVTSISAMNLVVIVWKWNRLHYFIMHLNWEKAACLLTISDNLVTCELTSSEERQSAFSEMMKIALELAE